MSTWTLGLVIIAPPLVSDLYSSGAQHVAIICDQWPHIASTLPIAQWETLEGRGRHKVKELNKQFC